MKFFYKGKDGGPESTVTGYWICEIKQLFSVVLLKFEGESREAYHSHAFNCVSWVLKGELHEFLRGKTWPRVYKRSWLPILTWRSTFHMVNSVGTTWVLSFRGPWSETWQEYAGGREYTLAKGREQVNLA